MTQWVHAGATTTYEYDKAGNITKRGGTTYSYDAADQLQPYYSGGQLVPVSHDEAGNMTRHAGYSYAYDAKGQLTSVTPMGGGNTIKYLYDPSGLLIRRTGDTTKAAFHWDGQTLVRIEYTGTGNTTYALSFTYDPAGKPLTVNRHSASGTSTYFYRANMRGDVTEITDSSGAKVASYVYDPWGTITDSWAATGQSIKDQNPLRYAGYIYDQGTGLYYLRARWYDPLPARFLTRDPLEVEDLTPQSLHKYAYGENNPVANTDRSGLHKDSAPRRRKRIIKCNDDNGYYGWGDPRNFWGSDCYRVLLGRGGLIQMARCWQEVPGHHKKKHSGWCNAKKKRNCSPALGHSKRWHSHHRH